MFKKVIFISTFILLFVINLCFANEEKSIPDKGTLGFIFNAENLLLDIESYQGGVGMKYRFNEVSSLRTLIDIYYSNNFNTFSSIAGITYENHFLNVSRLSPYWGFSINGGYITQSTITDEINYVILSEIPFGAEALFGIEIFFNSFISAFAEYSLSASFIYSSSETVVDGESTISDPEYQTVIDTGIGNNTSIGITIYINDIASIF